VENLLVAQGMSRDMYIWGRFADGDGSIVAFKPFAMLSHYSASKWAVRGFTQAFAMEMAEHKITVNGYAPGIVGTAMWDLIDEELGKKKGVQKGETINKYVTELTALGRVSVPEGRLVPFQFAINSMRFGDPDAVSISFRPRAFGLGRIEMTAISEAIQTFLDVKD